MSKIISAENECRVWAKSSIAENIFFGPFQGDFTRMIKRVQFLDTPVRHFEVRSCDLLLNLDSC